MENYRGENIDEFVENNLPLYISIVNNYNRDNCYTSNKELIDYCMVKYLESCQKYDENMGYKFSTFLNRTINNTICDYYTHGKEYRYKQNEYLSLNNLIPSQSTNKEEYIDVTYYGVEKFDTPDNQVLIGEIMEYINDNFSERNIQIFDRYLDGYKYEIIAREFNTTHQNISMIVQRIRKKIKANFDYRFD